MSSTPALDFRTIDFGKFVVPKLVKQPRGNLTSKPQYQRDTGVSTLSIQTPVMRLPFGVSNLADDAGEVSWSVNGAFDNYRHSPIMGDFYTFCTQVEEFVLAIAEKNSKEWFGKELSRETLAVMMNKWVRVNGDAEKAAKYDPTIKISVRTKKEGGGFWAECYGVDGKPMPLDAVPKYCRASMKIKLSSIYVVNKAFGFVWDLEWLKIVENPASSNFDFNPSLYGDVALPAAIPSSTPFSGAAPLSPLPPLGHDIYGDDPSSTTTSGEPAPLRTIAIPSLDDEAGDENNTTGSGGVKRERDEGDQENSAATSSSTGSAAPAKKAAPKRAK